MKKTLRVGVIAIAAIILLLSITSCNTNEAGYFKKIAEYSFWDNSGSEAIAQYKFYDIMDSYLSDDTIIDNGTVTGSDGRTKKILFLGWDGVRADALTNIFFDENNFNTNNYNYPAVEYSGLHRLKKDGGLYIAYAGGEKGKNSEQDTSTCAGWTSELTGGWNDLHGVVSNNDVKKADTDTILLKYAKLGLNTGLAFDWGQLFDTTLRSEVDFLLANPDIPMLLRDTDRSKAKDNNDIILNEKLKNEKEIRAKSLEHYNAVATDKIHERSLYDASVRDYLIERISAGDDIVAGIFHRPDTNGHTKGFGNGNAHYVNSVRNADVYLYQLLNIINERESKLNEDWLVIATADHGGSGKDHGKQVFEHRTIWVACNKVISDDYYGRNYDGYGERG